MNSDTETAFLYSRLSLPKNLILAEVFHRLHIIEKFGTGIDRIRNEYQAFNTKPQFEVADTHINIILPVIDYDALSEEHQLEETILIFISNKGARSRAEIEAATGYKRSWVLKELKRLVDEGKLAVVGSGKNTKYQLK